MRQSMTRFAVMSLLLLSSTLALHGADKRLLAYYEFDDQTNIPPYNATNIPYHELTHIIHSNILPSPKADGTLEIPDGFLEPRLISRAHRAGVKVEVCVAGDANVFAKIVGDPDLREIFAANLQAFVQKHGYDGVDIDWEVPEDHKQAVNFTAFLQDLRALLPAPQYLLSAAVSSSPGSWGIYDFAGMTPVLDFYNVMTYDFHGPWTNHSGHNSPLFLSPEDPGQCGSLRRSIDNYLTKFDVPAEKLNIGTAFYGYKFLVANLWDHCECSGEAFSMTYAQVKPHIGKGWTRYVDPLASAPYLVHNTKPGFITYDDQDSTSRKAEYVIKTRDLGGIFMWEISQDYDGHSQELMTALYRAFKHAGGFHRTYRASPLE